MDYKDEHEKCTCGNDSFFIIKVAQVNGNDDTFEYVCTKCGEIYEMFGEDEYGRR